MGLIPGFSSLSDETLNQGPMTIIQRRTDCDEARDLVFKPDLTDIDFTIIISTLPWLLLCSLERKGEVFMVFIFLKKVIYLLYILDPTSPNGHGVRVTKPQAGQGFGKSITSYSCIRRDMVHI